MIHPPKYFLFRVIVVVCLLPAGLLAQESFPELNNLILPSPTAASIGRFGEIPVGTYTGFPSIVVPLYTIRGKNYSLPVSLSYQSSGVKVDEIAGWTGLGWTLSAGGCVVRTVAGLPDDEREGYFYNGSLQLPPVQPGLDFQTDPLVFGSQQDKWDYLHRLASEQSDGQPDLFSFHFGGKSGKLFIDRDMNIILIPRQDLEVSLVRDVSGHIIEWVITDAQGTVFRFGENACHELTSSLGSNGGIQSSHISAWPLTSISTANGEDQFTLNYTDHYSVHAYQVPVRQSGAKPPLDELRQKSLSGHREKQLRQIRWREGRIDFRTDTLDSYPGGYTTILTSMELFTRLGIPVRSFVFNYSFFPAIGCGSWEDYLPPCRRPRLDKITEYATGGKESKPSWWFFYSPEPLPPRGSYSQDHWGFYNGRANAQPVPRSVVRNFPDPGEIPAPVALEGRYNVNDLTRINLNLPFVPDTEWEVPGADREPDPGHSLAGMLRKIVYPTGASTVFEFENHDFGYLSGISKRHLLAADAGSLQADVSESRNFHLSFPQIIFLQPIFGILSGSLKDQTGASPDDDSFIRIERYSSIPDEEPAELFKLSYTDVQQLADEGREGREIRLDPGRYRLESHAVKEDRVTAILRYQQGSAWDTTYPIYHNILKDTLVAAGSRVWPDDLSEPVTVAVSLQDGDSRRIRLEYYMYSRKADPNNIPQAGLDLPVSYCLFRHKPAARQPDVAEWGDHVAPEGGRGRGILVDLGEHGVALGRRPGIRRLYLVAQHDGQIHHGSGGVATLEVVGCQQLLGQRAIDNARQFPG